MANKTALIMATNGTEDMELIITSDILHRAGINVEITAVAKERKIVLAHRATLEADSVFHEKKDKDFDVVVLPGGAGYKNLCNDEAVGEFLKYHVGKNRLLGAICAAPMILKTHKIAEGATVTSYPGFENELGASYTYVEDKVCEWNNIVTSRGPGTAYEFALKLVEKLVGKEKTDDVRSKLLL